MSVPPPDARLAEYREALTSGRISARELLASCLDRVARLNPQLRAVLAVDHAGAQAAAEASDVRRSQGRVLGPLDGIPVLIKDNIEALGLPGTAGSALLADSPPVADAPLVERLRQAGAVVFGATNLSEWANFRSTASTSGWSALGGQTGNPYALDRSPSGSSSGSAAAVAAGLALLAVGTETDGSIVSPAGFCGVVGLKPSRGSVPGAGVVPISSVQDTAGPMARSVADARELYAVLSGRSLSSEPLSLEGLRVAIWRPDELDPGRGDDAAGGAVTRAVLESASELLASAGAALRTRTVTVTGPFEASEFNALVSEFAHELPRYLAGRPGPHPHSWAELLAFDRRHEVELSRFGDEIFELAAVAADLESEEYRTARAEADRSAQDVVSGLFDGDSFRADIVLTLANRPAFRIRYGQGEDGHLTTSSPAAVTGVPSLSLPGGYSPAEGDVPSGLPIGLLAMARHGEDELLLRFGEALEGLLPPRRNPPLF